MNVHPILHIKRTEYVCTIPIPSITDPTKRRSDQPMIRFKDDPFIMFPRPKKAKFKRLVGQVTAAINTPAPWNEQAD